MTSPSARLSVALASLVLLAGPALAGRTTTTTRVSTSDTGRFSYFYLSTSTEPGAPKDLAYAFVDAAQPEVDVIPNSRDRVAIQRALSASGGQVMWFRRDGRSWLLTDRRTIAAARELCQPMYWLSQAQTTISLGQSDLGREESRESARLSALAERLGEVSLRIDERRRKGDDVAALERERRSIEKEYGEAMGKGESNREAEAALDRTRTRLGARQSRITRQLNVAIERLFEQARGAGQLETIQG